MATSSLAVIPRKPTKLTTREQRRFDARNLRLKAITDGGANPRSVREALGALTSLSLDAADLVHHLRLLEYAREGALALVIRHKVSAEEVPAFFTVVEDGADFVESRAECLAKRLLTVAHYLHRVAR